jgi:hypothetical protein
LLSDCDFAVGFADDVVNVVFLVDTICFHISTMLTA